MAFHQQLHELVGYYNEHSLFLSLSRQRGRTLVPPGSMFSNLGPQGGTMEGSRTSSGWSLGHWGCKPLKTDAGLCLLSALLLMMEAALFCNTSPQHTHTPYTHTCIPPHPHWATVTWHTHQRPKALGLPNPVLEAPIASNGDGE